MNIKTLFTFLLIGSIAVSCKDEKKTEIESQKEEAPSYTVIVNATVKQSDNFQLFFKETTDENTQFSEENSVRVDVTGSEQPQDIVFTLPVDAVANQIRLDFGMNKEQKEIVVNNFTMKFKDKSFSLSATEFFEYFIPDLNSMNIDKPTKKVLPITSKDGVFDPRMYSAQTLADKIKTLQ
ncbi:MAG: hypothetical protein MUF43_07175 [Flavobacterium sp.]|jgi:hypothetical protein|nr:hypothetical protein [Flavobacterium sp.]